MAALIVIILFLLYVNNVNKKISDLERENRDLKRKLLEYQSNTVTERKVETINVQSQTTVKTRQIIPDGTSNVEPRKVLSEEEKQALKQKRERSEKEKKNTTILITGSILIVLAAIVFLMSTWNTISNIIKTLVLVLLIGVFLGASRIAKERFKLEKASNTFFYLAMAYIPICFLSCSIFGLFGDYFSIYGDGRYTYLAVSMVLTAGIYYLNYLTRKSNALLCGSILAQISALILFGLIFEENILLTAIILLIYNIALILLTKKNESLELMKYFYNGIPYIIGLLAVSVVFTTTSYMLWILPLLGVNFLLLYLKKEDTIQNAYLFNISVFLFGLYITLVYDYKFEIIRSVQVLLGILYTLIALVIEGIIFRKDTNIIKSSMVVSMVSIGIMYFRSIFIENEFLKPYMVALIEAALMTLVYFKSKEQGKQILSYLIPAALVITTWHVTAIYELAYQFYIILALLVFVIGECLQGKELEYLNKGFLVVSNINIVFVYFVSMMEFETEMMNDAFLFVLLLLVYVYSYIRNKNYCVFKYLAYLAFGLILVTGINLLKLPERIIALVPLIMTIVSLVLETKVRSINDQFSKIFINIFSVFTYFGLLAFEGLESIIIGLIFSGYLIYDNIKDRENKFLRLIPTTGFMLLLSSVDITEEMELVVWLITTVGITFVSIYQKQFTIDTIMSFIYLCFTLDRFDSEFIQEIFFIIWSFAHMYFVENDKSKDIFKVATYVGLFAIYNELIMALDMDMYYVCWEFIGIVTLAIAIMRNVLIKHIKQIDVLEYIVYGFIYLVAITSYLSELDGIIFVLFIVAVVMYAYMKKYGTLFIVSILAILVNAILLTREFWLAIPWWIYLLLVGGLLIGFAIKNESDDKKEKIDVGNVIKNIKDRIEK